MENGSSLKFMLALGMIKGIGPRYANQLLNEYGTAEAIFEERKEIISRIPYVGNALNHGISSGDALRKAEKEIEFCIKNDIQIIDRENEKYPYRMAECNDAPLCIYVKGNVNFNSQKIISVVGTRHSTQYGTEITRSIISTLAKSFPDLIIVSGLAYGIDICAHRSALDSGLETVAVLAHGLDRIYPADHLRDAQRIIRQGALISEYGSEIEPEKGNFLARNRIIAAISSGTIVVESDKRGGAMATARVALSYDRDVMCVPGRTLDRYSRGCNYLIKNNIASLITSAEDVAEVLGWQAELNQDTQQVIDFELSQEEKLIISILDSGESVHLNNLAEKSGFNIPVLAGILIDLEMRKLIRQRPGSMYRIKNQ